MAVIKEENYHDEQNKNNILKLRKVLDTLPPFCRDFFRGIEPYTSTRTRLAYAYDIRLFFEFLHETNSFCKKREITELPLSVLDMVQRTDIEEYLDYMSLYQKDGKDITNEERGKARKLAALRSFYNYYFQSERIEKNTAALVPLPKRLSFFCVPGFYRLQRGDGAARACGLRPNAGARLRRNIGNGGGLSADGRAVL
mgnify:CR=1 FL=1